MHSTLLRLLSANWLTGPALFTLNKHLLVKAEAPVTLEDETIPDLCSAVSLPSAVKKYRQFVVHGRRIKNVIKEAVFMNGTCFYPIFQTLKTATLKNYSGSFTL